MRSLDVNTKNVVTELRENFEDQLIEAQKALNTKIDDVERKTMSFAQRAASGQGDQQKGKSNIKDQLKQKMK